MGTFLTNTVCMGKIGLVFFTHESNEKPLKRCAFKGLWGIARERLEHSQQVPITRINTALADYMGNFRGKIFRK